MSVQATSWVIRHSPHKGSELLCLIMIADHASPDGTNAYPSIKTLAAECRMSDRQVSRIVHRLEESGAITVDRSSGRVAHVYTVNMSGLDVVNIDTLSGSNADKKSGLRRKPTLTNPSPNPDKSSPNPDILARNPDIAMSPPSEPREPMNPEEPDTTDAARASPHEFVVVFLEERGADDSEAPQTWINEQHKHAEALIDMGCSETDLRTLTRYALSQTWRNTAVTLKTLRAIYGDWVVDGRPEREKSRRGAASQEGVPETREEHKARHMAKYGHAEVYARDGSGR